MAPPDGGARLAWPERLKVVFGSLGFLLVLGFLGWLFWTFNPAREAGRVWDGYWEPVRAGRYRVPKGFVVLLTLAGYLVLLPVAFLVFAAGLAHGLRGRRTRLAAWVLRGASQRDVRERHEQRLRAAEA